MKRNLIVFTGKAGSGKTEAANYLVSRGYTRIKFADPPKNMLRTLGLTEAHIEGDLKNKPCELLGGKSPRYAMITLGTEWGRNLISTDLWVEAWKRQVSECKGLVVTDDCRFLNEAKAAKEMGAILIKIVKSDADGTLYTDHQSETEMDQIEPDRVIENSGSLIQFLSKIHSVRIAHGIMYSFSSVFAN